MDAATWNQRRVFLRWRIGQLRALLAHTLKDHPGGTDLFTEDEAQAFRGLNTAVGDFCDVYHELDYSQFLALRDRRYLSVRKDRDDDSTAPTPGHPRGA